MNETWIRWDYPAVTFTKLGFNQPRVSFIIELTSRYTFVSIRAITSSSWRRLTPPAISSTRSDDAWKVERNIIDIPFWFLCAYHQSVWRDTTELNTQSQSIDNWSPSLGDPYLYKVRTSFWTDIPVKHLPIKFEFSFQVHQVVDLHPLLGLVAETILLIAETKAIQTVSFKDTYSITSSSLSQRALTTANILKVTADASSMPKICEKIVIKWKVTRIWTRKASKEPSNHSKSRITPPYHCVLMPRGRDSNRVYQDWTKLIQLAYFQNVVYLSRSKTLERRNSFQRDFGLVQSQHTILVCILDNKCSPVRLEFGRIDKLIMRQIVDSSF